MVIFFFLMIRRPPRSTLFPYTTPLPILPIESHILQAFVTEPLKPLIHCVVTFGAGHMYVSQSDKRSEEHTSELQSRQYLVCRLLLEKKNIHRLAWSLPATYIYRGTHSRV